MSENRKHHRWETSELLQRTKGLKAAYIEVTDTRSEKCIGNLLDLSRAGMKIICGAEIRRGTSYSFSFPLPIEKGKSAIVFVDARCVWCERERDGTVYRAGFMFKLVLDESRKHIDTLLESKEELSFQPSI